MLLDEPTTGLDLGHQQTFLELVDEVRRDRRTTVISAIHDLTMAARYADRLVLLSVPLPDESDVVPRMLRGVGDELRPPSRFPTVVARDAVARAEPGVPRRPVPLHVAQHRFLEVDDAERSGGSEALLHP